MNMHVLDAEMYTAISETLHSKAEEVASSISK